MVATAHGDYFRLLNPSKTYTVSASAEGYERSVQKVYVPNNNEEAEEAGGASPLELFSAKILNFTLNVDKSKAWSKSNDFGIDENRSWVQRSLGTLLPEWDPRSSSTSPRMTCRKYVPKG